MEQSEVIIQAILATWSAGMNALEWITLSAVAVGIVGGTGRYVLGRFHNLDKEVASVRYNYLDRFTKLHEAVSAGNGEILEKLGDLELKISEKYMSKSECPFFERKEKQ